MKTAQTRVVPQARPGAETRVAVLLNAHARKVDARVVESLQHVVPKEDLFLSRSPLEARRIAQTVVARRYPVIFTGGGDGTFMGFVNEILNEWRAQGSHRFHPLPRFGVLKLGTGNSLASLVGASSLKDEGFLDDVLKARHGEVSTFRKLELLDIEGKRAPFAGLGVDAQLLNDYFWVKQNWARGPLSRILTGGRGYFTSVALRTLPFYFTHSTQVECEIRNVGDGEAHRIGPDGQSIGSPIAPGEMIFQGSVMLVCAGTVPHYGYELKMFPFAGKRPGMMHLRLGTVTPVGVVANLPRLWAGRYFPETIHDFHAQRVEIRYAQPMPLQVGGDAEGYREKITFGMARETLELVDFSASAH